YDAFGQRQISTLYTQFNQYHVILEASPEFQENPQKLQDIYLQNSSAQSSTSSSAASTPRRSFSNSASTPVRTLAVSSTSGISGAQRSGVSGFAGTSSNTAGAL